MKKNNILLAALFIFSNSFCFAQEVSTSVDNQIRILYSHSNKISPLYILKAGDKMVELDAQKNEFIDLESIDNNWVTSIDILNAESAIEVFGEKGSNGVVIVNFKKNYILVKEAHMLLVLKKSKP
jgi:hypothetical protein